MQRLWDKGGNLDAAILRFTVGQDHVLDERLVAFDARASAAHANMLAQQGYLSAEQAAQLGGALEAIAAEHARGDWHIALEEEDCHTAIEARLTQRLGELGGRIHLGRSRNDQVLAALRLYLLAVVDELHEQAGDVVEALDGLVQRQGDLAMPGYTHLQRAMPSTVELWAAAYASEIEDDRAGLLATRRRIAKNPLGSAAGYGVPVLKLDRHATAEALGFAEVQDPVTAVQLSRGKAEAQLVFELVLLMQDIGRLAADLCLFASAEFAFVKLPAAFTTGSSIMPQKRNPDVFELLRARSSQFPADLAAILALTAKMTSGYHRDMQLLKEPLFRAIDQAQAVLAITAHALPGLEFQAQAMVAAMDRGLFATEAAYRLVQDEGVPFREAYRRVGAQFAGPGKP
ncbi:MAG: argininosuccinate lyase [Planctomycetota bacterium]